MVPIILKRLGVNGFILRMKRPTLIQIIANTDDFKFFKYKAKLLRNAATQPAPNPANGILKKRNNKNNCCAIKLY